jgi:steroid 5-alpha reductase family enzyme
MGKFFLFVAGAFCASFILVCAVAGAPFPGAGVSMILGGEPLAVVALWALGFALTSFAAGMVSGDYSWVDRLWSTLPVGFAWYYAWRGGFSAPILVAALMVTVWGARLTANFAKKGGYSGTEDYRWAILRGRMKRPLAWQAFNLSFISLFQTGTFVLFTMPLSRIAQPGGAPSAANAVLFAASCALMGFAIAFEAAADREQWNFQEAKRLIGEGKPAPARFEADAARGFRTSGLFSVSRHPNYFGELMTWFSLYLMGGALRGRSVADAFLHPSVTGILVLVAIFSGSTIFTESITASKYPAYGEYRERVSAILPWFPGKGDRAR